MEATFTVGTHNVLGANWSRREHPWRDRAPALGRVLRAADADVWLLTEVNRPVQRRDLARTLPGWTAVTTRGHNDVYVDPARQRVLGWREVPLGTLTLQQRWATLVDLEHVASGVRWTAVVTHLSSSVGSTRERAAISRTLQARTLAGLARSHGVDVLAGDLNNALVRDDTPRGILGAAGLEDWRDAAAAAGVDALDADLDTHHAFGHPPRRSGRHLDAVLLGQRVDVVAGRVDASEPLASDHFPVVCTIRVRAADDGTAG